MQIDVDLGIERLNDLAAATVAECAAFFKLPEDTTITIAAQPMGDYVKGDADAACLRSDDGKSFFIAIDEDRHFTEIRLVELIGHEMTHVKQYVKGEIADLGNKTVRFGRRYFRNRNEMEYWLAPWEMEARAMEQFFVWRMECEGWTL